MRRNGAEHIGINQQPVQAPHRLQRLHDCMSPSPAQPSPAHPFRAARLFVEPRSAAMCCRYVLPGCL